ncbi:MAG: c-type cytochrome [Labilithrix sp.]|nr:c-type cytochrome [Labilithrix sp.]
MRESSAVAIVKVAERPVAFATDADDRAIRAFDARTLEPLAQTDLPSAPRDLLIAADGTMYATLPESSELVAFEIASADGALREKKRAKTSTEPLAMALTADEAVLVVTTGASHRLDAYDASSLAKQWSRDVGREPRAVIVASDGANAYVSHAAEAHLSVVPMKGAESIERAPLGLGNGFMTKSGFGGEPARAARHAYALVRSRSPKSEEGERILAPLVQNATEGASPVAGGYGSSSGFGSSDGFGSSMFPMKPMAPFDDFAFKDGEGFVGLGLSALDVRAVEAGAKLPLGRVESRNATPGLVRDCLLPRAAIATANGLVVACEGQSEVVELDVSSGWPEVIGRWPVARGPSAIARLPATSRAIVWSPIARALTAIDLSRDAAIATEEVAPVRPVRIVEPLAQQEVPRARPADERELAGREIFHRTGDRNISRTGVACASCHPDGRDDGLVWNGPLGARHSLTLAGNVARKGPIGWGGEHDSLEGHVKETIKRLGGRGLPDGEFSVLMAYLRSMKPIPAEAQAMLAKDDALAERGAAIFRSDRAACNTCHIEGAAYSDREKHDVGSGGSFVTPSLAGAGARSTFFHDGRFRDLDDLLARSPRMGGGSSLSSDDRKALAAYLRTL